MSDEQGAVIASIKPGKDGEPPIFEIVERRESQYLPTPAGVRTCEHGDFKLDTKWATVTCGFCHEKLDPFAVLLAIADGTIETRRECEHLRRVETDLIRERLRSLRARRGTRPDERAEITKAVNGNYNREQLKELRARIEAALRGRGARI